MDSSIILSTFFRKHLVKGFLQHEEGLALYRYAKRVKRHGACLEIGSYCGKSSVYLGQACKESENILFAVDHHRGSEEHQPGEAYHDGDLFDESISAINSFPIFQRTLHLAELENTVIPVVTSSQILAKHWNQKLGLVFIDGGHSEEQAMHDVLAWARHVEHGAWMAIHDIYDSPDEGGQAPRRAMLALLENPAWRMRERIASLAFLQRCD